VEIFLSNPDKNLYNFKGYVVITTPEEEKTIKYDVNLNHFLHRVSYIPDCVII